MAKKAVKEKLKPGPAPGTPCTWGGEISKTMTGRKLTNAHKKAIKRAMKALWASRRKVKQQQQEEQKHGIKP